MTLETAKKLAWPWSTEHCWYDTDFGWKHGLWCAAVSPSCKKNKTYYQCPSVEEMLERMPATVSLEKPHNLKTDDRYLAYYMLKNSHAEYADNPSEALALLCIWLRDNNLMKWE